MPKSTPYTPENCATDWRDLADQLTDDNVGVLEDIERDPKGPRIDLLAVARSPSRTPATQ